MAAWSQAGFLDQEVKISPLALNHSGKIGKLFCKALIVIYTTCFLSDSLTFHCIQFIIGIIFKQPYINCKPLLAKVNTEWLDDKEYSDYIKSCCLEAKEYKAGVNFYACYAQKPCNDS
jgi:hypothetical protein